MIATAMIEIRNGNKFLVTDTPYSFFRFAARQIPGSGDGWMLLEAAFAANSKRLKIALQRHEKLSG